MGYNIVIVLLITGFFGSVVPFYFCSIWCYDTKPLCALCASSGSMMEFKSPCYMVTYNSCHGTRYSTLNFGLCPVLATPEPPMFKVDYDTTSKVQETLSPTSAKNKENIRRQNAFDDDREDQTSLQSREKLNNNQEIRERQTSYNETNGSWQDRDTTLT